MQAKTFKSVVITTMLAAVVLPAIIWFIDHSSQQSGWFAHIIGSFAIMAVPVLWVIGNVISGIVALQNRRLIGLLFKLQCAVSIFILAVSAYFLVIFQLDSHQVDLRNDVLKAIQTRDINQYKHALKQCGKACLNQQVLSNTRNTVLYDVTAYKEWLVTAVAANSVQIVDDLLIDQHRPIVALVGLGAPNVQLSYACAGYYVGDANVFAIAVLQKSPAMLQHLIATANVDDKSNALWHAVRANRTDYVQILLNAGAIKNIKDEYGGNGVENAGYSLLDAAVEGYAINTLQWLLQNGFAPNGQLGTAVNGQAETATHKHTPLHSIVFAANNEQSQFGTLNRSIQMWQVLIKAGADDTIAQAQNNSDAITPLQQLLQSNVYEDSAKIVKAFVALNISSKALTAPQQLKLAQFMQTPIDVNKRDGGQLDLKYCAERQLETMYGANAYK